MTLDVCGAAMKPKPLPVQQLSTPRYIVSPNQIIADILSFTI